LLSETSGSGGIGWGDLNVVIESYTVGTALFMSFVNILIFSFLAFYLD